MKLRQVEVFHAIMLAGTVSGAARILNISQPAVTKVLLHAEDQLGFKLFHRNKGRVVPTAEAAKLFVEAERAFAAIDAMRQLAGNLRKFDATCVRVAAPPALCIDLVPEVISEFLAEAAHVTFELYSYHYESAVTAVLRQDVDLAIVFNPTKHPALTLDHLSTGSFIGCFPKSKENELPARVPLSEFQKYPFIALSARDPIGAEVRTALRSAEVNFATCVEVNTNAIALGLVRRGAGAAIVDEYTARSVPAGVTVRPIDPHLTFELGLLTLLQAPSSNVLQRFRQLLQAANRRACILTPSLSKLDVSPLEPRVQH